MSSYPTTTPGIQAKKTTVGSGSSKIMIPFNAIYLLAVRIKGALRWTFEMLVLDFPFPGILFHSVAELPWACIKVPSRDQSRR